MSDSAVPGRAPFFVRFLTRRHLLTWRSLVLVPLLLLASFVAVTLFRSSSADSSAATAGDGSVAGTDGVARRLIVDARPLSRVGPEFLTQQFVGIVLPRRASGLAAKAVGRVEQVWVEMGDFVEKGQTLIELDHAQLDAQAQLVAANLQAARSRLEEFEAGPRAQDIEQAEAQVGEARANLTLAEANLARVRQLHSTAAISKQELDENIYQTHALVARLELAEKQLELLLEGTREEQIDAQRAVVAGLEAQLRRTKADIQDQTIIAPFSGQIQSRQVDEGVVVSPGQQLVSLVEEAPYEVRIGLPPDLTSELTESGLSVTKGSQQLSVSIDRIAPAITDATRTREVVLRLSESSSKLVGLGAAVTISVRIPVQTRGFWVPSQALTAGARGLWAVYVVSPSSKSAVGNPLATVEMRQVELLRSHGEWSEIRGPIDDDDVIITDGLHRVAPGQEVQLAIEPAMQ